MPVISQLAVSGYRSLRDIKLLLAPLTIITGANGTGKSSVYRALRLLACLAVNNSPVNSSRTTDRARPRGGPAQWRGR